MIDPNIALQVKPLQIDTPGIVNMIQQGRNQGLQQALHAQQLREGQQQMEARALAMQQTQQGITDDKAARDFFAQNPNATDEDMISKLGPKVAHPIIQERYKSKESQLKMAGEKLDLFGRIAGAVKDENSLHVGVQAALAHGLITPEESERLHRAGWTPETQAYIAQHAAEGLKAKEQVDAAIAQTKEQREAAESAAKMPGLIAESDSKVQKATGTEKIQPYQAAELAGQAITRDETALQNQATRENMQAMRLIASGNLAISREHADIARKIYEQTYGDGANPALQGVEPKLRTQATTQAQKAADEFTKAMESSSHVQTFIDLARNGNKAAGSNLPMMGAESIQALNGIKRINRAEIEQYGGAGSLLDRIQGRIGKIVSGQPIPADVMKDIEDLHKAIAGNATNAYNTRLNGINQNYRSNFQPVKGEAQQPAALSTGHKVGDVVNVRGKNVKISAVHPDGSFDGDEVK